MNDPAHTYPDGTTLADLAPCPCGNREWVRLKNRATGRTRTVCPRCVRQRQEESLIDRIFMSGDRKR